MTFREKSLSFRMSFLSSGSPFVRQNFCPPFRMSVPSFVCLNFRMSARLFICMSFCRSLHLFVCSSFFCLLFRLSVLLLSFLWSVCPIVCLPVLPKQQSFFNLCEVTQKMLLTCVRTITARTWSEGDDFNISLKYSTFNCLTDKNAKNLTVTVC